MSKIQKLTVGDKVYEGDQVPDGFFDSLKSLKTMETKVLESSPSNSLLLSDYPNIIKLCEQKSDLPLISMNKSSEILHRLRASVSDISSISTLHYIHGGIEAYKHFNFLLKSIIEDVNNASLIELNSVHGLVLYKGHGKEKTSDRSYRTISTCPLVSKSLDLYIHDIFSEKWTAVEAPTQYLGSGKSHELASLLVTEAIQASLHTNSKPIFLLFLDARSAFDRVVRQLLVRNLYKSGMYGSSLRYIDNRLKNRKTYLEHDKVLMGPIHDKNGVEQGGINSGDFFKIYNNEQFETGHSSNLGVQVSNTITISTIGQADDACLLSDDIYNLQYLLMLSLQYCKKFDVDLCAEKTKLLALSTKDAKVFVDIFEAINPIKIDGHPIKFVQTADHVGVVRSADGNLPHIISRISSHKKALGATMSAGIAQNHRANPTASLKAHQVYASTVLMSGMASLHLNTAEVKIIDQHVKVTVQNLQKLHANTPSSFVFFMGGTLPGTAVLHQRQLSLFGMICRLPDNVLHNIAMEKLSFGSFSSKSWFLQVRDLCMQYQLPHPLDLLEMNLSKSEYKKLVNAHIINFWEIKLRQEAAPLPSLKYFHPNYMSLTIPHPIWSSAKSNPYQMSKALVQARMLSGRYRTEYLCRHWSMRDGTCLASSCAGLQQPETIEHILLFCPSYANTRSSHFNLWRTFQEKNPFLSPIISKALTYQSPFRCQFILDSTVLPDVISLSQIHGQAATDKLLYMSRTFCYAIHRERLRNLGRWSLR